MIRSLNKTVSEKNNGNNVMVGFGNDEEITRKSGKLKSQKLSKSQKSKSKKLAKSKKQSNSLNLP